MAAPSKTWVTIADTQVDADSPLDTTLITGLRDNLIHLEEWLGSNYTAAQDHEHNGNDSAQIKDANITKSGAVVLFDDFLLDGLTGWMNVNSGAAPVDIENGAVRFTIPALTPSVHYGIATASTNLFRIASGVTVTVEMRFKENTLCRRRTLGLIRSSAIGDPTTVTDGAWFDRNDATGYWQVTTGKASVGTTTTLNVASSTAYQTLKIVATTADVKFYVDTVLKATHTTNIPTANLAAAFLIWTNSGSEGVRSADVDYVHIYTSARP